MLWKNLEFEFELRHLDIIHQHIETALAFFFPQKLFAVADDSLGRLSDEGRPQKLYERCLEENSSFGSVVLTEDFITAHPILWCAIFQLIDLFWLRQQQKHEHVDALLVHKLTREFFWDHKVPDSFANYMFGFEFHRRLKLLELPTNMLAKAS